MPAGYEPVWQNGSRVGFITSGGYGHTLEASRWRWPWSIPRRRATEGTGLLMVHVVGEERAAKGDCGVTLRSIARQAAMRG